jgi:hypothetical protein
MTRSAFPRFESYQASSVSSICARSTRLATSVRERDNRSQRGNSVLRHYQLNRMPPSRHARAANRRRGIRDQIPVP